MARKDCNGHLLLLFLDYQSPFYHLETRESNGIWDDDGRPFLIIWRFFAASFVIQRQSSPMTHKGSLLLSRRQSSPVAYRDKHSHVSLCVWCDMQSGEDNHSLQTIDDSGVYLPPRVCVGTSNVGGKLPPMTLILIIGLASMNQLTSMSSEILPLNLGNIFGAKDTRPIPKWVNIIQETLNRVQPKMPKIKSFSDPPSPSKFKPSDDVPDIEEEILLESDSDIGEEVHPLDE
ncbi:hypothetical protein JHK87_055794 [Glycine soja]|nr:hypothetical protein JHK87_055794 [Glycine soja]